MAYRKKEKEWKSGSVMKGRKGRWKLEGKGKRRKWSSDDKDDGD